MYMFRNVFLALCLGLIAAPALAQDAPVPPGLQAGDLVAACQGEGRHYDFAVGQQWDTALFAQVDFVECAAYLAGLADMNAVAKRVFGRGIFCLPRAGVTAEQQIAALLRWAKAHPHLLHESRRSAAVSAFVEAWPCV
ncbi:MAG: Rap1a/Tai family immunity protein [Kiloniellales bacterium]|nr:Rap1a/Tai family immunity protein [Kiloniellales bacterium]